jgi:hypothetical protein
MPGCVPASLRLAAIATVAGFRDSVGNFALDACIPVRAADVERRGTLEGIAGLVFLHVDGETSLQDIASRTELSLEETIAICFDLVARGIVEISNAEVAS